MKNITYTMAFWLLRFWLAMRAIGTGLTKFMGKQEMAVDNPAFKEEVAKFVKDGLTQAEAIDAAKATGVAEKVNQMVDFLSFSNYHGLPSKGPMTVETFSASPLMPSFAVEPYAFVLGFALIGLGLTTLLGICTRISLFLMGLLYISLTDGFVILEPSMGPSAAAGIAYLGVHMVLIVGALMLADYNKFELFPCKKFCGKCSCEK